ncbi:Imm49 family immunity protein [Streptomyces sp. NPDC046832]|uniref:Imm49 family immunity protein n=1 Tax=Streptomyces sp. NPDC046832 TaxID=3155020 RepID=UPI003408968C
MIADRADRADDPDAAVDLDFLALACHARRRGWAVRVASPYLPQGLLRAANPSRRPTPRRCAVTPRSGDGHLAPLAP